MKTYGIWYWNKNLFPKFILTRAETKEGAQKKIESRDDLFRIIEIKEWK